MKLRTSTYDILIYLAKETIAQIIDYVFLLRQDRLAVPGNPYSRAAVLNAQSTLRKEIYGSDTKVCIAYLFCKSYSSENDEYFRFYLQVSSVPPIMPEEVREAVRRYWSCQLCPFNLLSRSVDRYPRNRIMACD